MVANGTGVGFLFVSDNPRVSRAVSGLYAIVSSARLPEGGLAELNG